MGRGGLEPYGALVLRLFLGVTYIAHAYLALADTGGARAALRRVLSRRQLALTPGEEAQIEDCEDLSTLLSGQSRGNQRSAADGRLCHNHAQGQPADDAIPSRKVLAVGWRTHRHLRQNRPPLLDLSA